MIGRVLNRLLRQGSIGLISRMRIGAGQQAGTERIGVVNLLVLGRDIADAERVSFRMSVKIAQNMLTGADGNLQVAVPL